MKWQVLAVVAVVCMTAAVNGQDQIKNYFVHGVANGTELIVIDNIPDGFRMTDFKATGWSGRLSLFEFTAGGELIERYAYYLSPASPPLTFVSPMVFQPGSQLRVENANSDANDVRVFVSGYIPGPNQGSSVPALGTFSFGVMVLLAIGAGAVVFRRKRREA